MFQSLQKLRQYYRNRRIKIRSARLARLRASYAPNQGIQPDELPTQQFYCIYRGYGRACASGFMETPPQ